MANKLLKGKCGCGAVTYRMKAQPLFVHCCHCSDCQRQTGTAFVLNALIEADNVEFEGPTRDVKLETPSGEGQLITRCAECGVAVFSSYLIRKGKMRYVRVGTLEEPGALPPDVHIFTSTKLPWVKLEDDVPIYEEFYSIPKVWPKPSLDRLRVLFDG